MDNGATSASLEKAIAYCYKNKVTLIVATLDCLSTNVDTILELKKKLRYLLKSCDIPASDTFSFALSLGLKQRNKMLISIATKAALAASKAKGKKLGNTKNLTTEGRILGLEKIRKGFAPDHKTLQIIAIINRCKQAEMGR